MPTTTLPRVYDDGTVAAENGSTTLTLLGTGPLWTALNCTPSSLIIVNGYVNFVSARDDDGRHLDMVMPYQGADATGLEYAIYPLTSNEVATATLNDRVAQFIQQLNEIAGGTGIHIDAFGNYADRATFDTEYLNDSGAKFVFLSMDGAGGAGGGVVAYVKNTATSGDWSAAIAIQGMTGAAGATVEEVLDELGIHSITVSTDPPSGGVNGDIWLQVLP